MIKEQERGLWEQWRQGKEEARVDLLRSLNPIIQKNVNKFAASGLPRSAVETEARRLVLQSFETYDPTKSAVATHATNHLKHLQRFVLEYQNIGKIPEHRGLAITKYKSIHRQIKEDLGREPTIVELADELKWSNSEVMRMQSELRSDLTISSFGDEDEPYIESIFHEIPETEEIAELLYYESDPEEQVILEHWLQSTRTGERLPYSEIALKLNKPESYVKRKANELGEKIN
jgi:DNA-directed RNA polymerase sigma subunit (sigma70/sigma32)